MRDFACKDKEYLSFPSNASRVEGEPCSQIPAYAVCLTDQTIDGAVLYHDMVSVIQEADKFAERVGPSVVQDLMYQLQPQPLQAIDKMTDDEKFDCVVSRYCQTMSERASLLQYLTDEHNDLLKQFQLGEDDPAPSPSATGPSENV